MNIQDNFIPPIKTRSTQELLDIVGNKDGWNIDAFTLAKAELINRNVSYKKIETAEYINKKKKRIERQRIANEGYHICDFIASPFPTLFELLFAWELKKDGRLKKAKQQKYFRISILILIVVRVAYLYINNQVLDGKFN